MAKSSIEWTESTWNPVTGCTKISSGCRNCYAERMAKRLQAMGQPNYANGFQVTTHAHMLDRPHSWRKPQFIFVNSMSDLFHEDVPESFIRKVFHTIRETPWHRYQILTKRSKRLAELSPELNWPENVWMGVSVESNDQCYRIDHLRQVRVKVKFLSLEPLIGPLPDLKLNNIDWVVVGGESGPGARPMSEKWVLDIKELCLHKQIPFFFKQWGGFNKKKNGRELQGKFWDQRPNG